MPTTVSLKTEASFLAAAKKIAKFAQQLRTQAVPNGLRLIGEEIMTDVKASSPGRGVPVDQGHLRDSGVVEEVSPTAIDLSFGDSSAPYALIQHEETQFHHTVGEARYLVRGLERWKPGGSAAMEGLKLNAEEAIKAASK